MIIPNSYNERPFHPQEALDALWRLYEAHPDGVRTLAVAKAMRRSVSTVRRKLVSLADVKAVAVVDLVVRGKAVAWVPLSRVVDRGINERKAKSRGHARCPRSGARLGVCSVCGAEGVAVDKHLKVDMCRDCLCGDYEPTRTDWRTQSPMALF